MSKETENQQRKRDLFRQLKDRREDVKHLEESILGKYGWDHRCDFPDACWRWVKVTKGMTVATDQKSALRMEENTIE